ncbi:class I SAM-dependent methyltransferase [Neisseria sp. Ec49-e6-T10]|uniref:class I SAM-dependent methyltransferase n=1 Tax=Neisseria sp. Ec49-e6-T10 TaxID=3140744 RepID=UPI003EB783BE
MINDDQLKTLAEQLRCPDGEGGVKLGNQMNISNLSVILNGIANVHIRDHDHILELGYGNGGLLGYILSLADDIRYTGLEVSPTMHQEAIALNQPYIDAGLAQYQLYDGTSLPFAPETFDKVLTVNTIYFWQEPLLLLDNIGKVLKKGGYLCLTFCDKTFMQTLPFIEYGFQLYDAQTVKALVRDLPLKFIREDCKKDKSISKIGTLVDREFTSLVFEKIA